VQRIHYRFGLVLVLIVATGRCDRHRGLGGRPLRHWPVREQLRDDFLYLSYATLTTVGYGDLVAATNLGRSLAITEALVGQLYLVTVVAVIISNLEPGRRRTRDAQEG
jgi:hypothetical protein